MSHLRKKNQEYNNATGIQKNELTKDFGVNLNFCYGGICHCYLNICKRAPDENSQKRDSL